MSEYKSVAEIIDEIGSSKPRANMPLGYSSGYPVITLKKDRISLVVPYLKYKMNGKPDQTLVYPIRYLITYAVRDGVITAFEDLKENKHFENVDFEKPIGLFRHDSIKNLKKQEYIEKRDQLFALYDGFIASLIEKKDFPMEDLKKLKELLSLLLEPSLKPIYKALYPNFYKMCIE